MASRMYEADGTESQTGQVASAAASSSDIRKTGAVVSGSMTKLLLEDVRRRTAQRPDMWLGASA